MSDRQLARDPELVDRDTLDSLLENAGHLFITFDPKPPAEGIETAKPTAEILAGIAARLTETQIDALAAAAVVPHYMSAPFVTAAKKKPRRG